MSAMKLGAILAVAILGVSCGAWSPEARSRPVQ